MKYRLADRLPPGLGRPGAGDLVPEAGNLHPMAARAYFTPKVWGRHYLDDA